MATFADKDFEAPVVGVTNYPEAVSRSAVDEAVKVIHEPDNAYDSNAMKVLGSDNRHLGYLPAKLSEKLVSRLGQNCVLVGTITAVLTNKENTGLRITVKYSPDSEAEEAVTQQVFSRSGRLLGEYRGEKENKILIGSPSGVLQVPKNAVTVK